MAYRKALLGECIAHLTGYTPAMGERPKGKIVSEDIIREDSEVPQEEVQEFILELQQEAESLRLEMKKFDFVKREQNVQQFQPQEEASNGQRGKPPGQKGKRRNRQPRQG